MNVVWDCRTSCQTCCDDGGRCTASNEEVVDMKLLDCSLDPVSRASIDNNNTSIILADGDMLLFFLESDIDGFRA